VDVINVDHTGVVYIFILCVGGRGVLEAMFGCTSLPFPKLHVAHILNLEATPSHPPR
jgi:hypothetical protein